MSDSLRDPAHLAVAAVLGVLLGWLLRNAALRRARRRKQRFFGLPDHSETALVVGRDAGSDGAVARPEVFALLELSALIKECGAQAGVVWADSAHQGFGERTEFCLGPPVSNRRMAAHLRSLLPGVVVSTDPESGQDRGTFVIGSEHYKLDPGAVEYVLLARLTAGEHTRPVFLACGQRPVTLQAATRYLARQHRRLSRKHGPEGTFCLLLKVVNSHAYGPDVVELVADVTRPACAAPRTPAEPAEEGTVRKRLTRG
ncbi:hypothetical protein MTQ01_14485 [Streptomyces sp. XM4193]|uniref:hypothetical protein n=1 Tax=Streptomyces sp. XM4193 TaxID=2929782 RepID=UPI001FFA21A1|nr:hypothetical protein [Streptomyces sp. XM4193]MCK1797206.1 hypothetical protein [Streptomyces sp. XM4193]